MKERPILFSTLMVQAMLEGRKTQTRRLIKPQPVIKNDTIYGENNRNSFSSNEWGETWKCPFGQPGDILFVRESHFRFGEWKKNGLTKTGKQKWRFFPAKDLPNFRYQDDPPFKVERNSHRSIGWYKRTSLFMPKEFTRVWLEVTGIKVERLRDITEEDAMAEGIELEPMAGYNSLNPPDPKFMGRKYDYSKEYVGNKTTMLVPIESYASLWRFINGPDSWKENPWVWVVSFKVLSTIGKALHLSTENNGNKHAKIM